MSRAKLIAYMLVFAGVSSGAICRAEEVTPEAPAAKPAPVCESILLRDYYLRTRERVEQRATNPTPATTYNQSERKTVVKQLEAGKNANRELSIATMGSLSIRDNYFEKTNVTVDGRPMIFYKLKKLDALKTDITDIINDLRKLIKADDNTDPSAEAYTLLLKDFLKDYEKENTRWLDKKIEKYHSVMSTQNMTLFDLVEALVADHARDNHLYISEASDVKHHLGLWILSKLGVSESARHFWKKKIQGRFANYFIDATVGLPGKIPQIIITSLVTAWITGAVVKSNTKAQIEKATTSHAAREATITVESQKEELQKLVKSLNSYNETFASLVGNEDREAIDTWKMFNDKYLDLSKTFAKFKDGHQRLAMDNTTKLVIDTFIKNATSVHGQTSDTEKSESETQTLARTVANQLLLKSLLQGEPTAKDDLKKQMSEVTDYGEFNAAFVDEATRIAQAMSAAIEHISVNSAPAAK